MRTGAWLKWIGILVAIVVVMAIAVAVVGVKFGYVGDRCGYIDVSSGETRTEQDFLGMPFNQKMTPTPFSQVVQEYGLTAPNADWRQISQFGWVSGGKASFPMSGADTACIGAAYTIQSKGDKAEKRQLLESYVKMLRAGDVKGMEQLTRRVVALEDSLLPS